MQKLQLENQDLRKQLLQLRTQQEHSARATKKAETETPSDAEDSKISVDYGKPSRILGLMQNPWITRGILQQPIPAMKHNDPGRYDNDSTRADGEVADVYATFPSHLHAGILQDGEIRSKVSVVYPSYARYLCWL